jgi:PHD-finger
MAELFSPVSETSGAGPPPVPCSVYDDVPGAIPGGRMSAPADIPMSPFSSAGGGGPPQSQHGQMMMPGPGNCGPGQPYPPGMPMGPQSSMMPGGPGGPMPPAMHHPGGPMMGGMPMHGKVYPPNQPMVFNPANPNAPPIYPCGVCHKEIHDNDQAILCESGCNFWFHRTCTGLTDCAYVLLTKEVYAEWVCDHCLSSRNIPLVKLKP